MLQLRPVALALVALLAALGVAATGYVRSPPRPGDKAALSAVRAAAAAAEAWYQDPLGGGGSYRGLDEPRLAHEAPSVSPRVRVTVLAGGRAYCLDDEEGVGHSAYYVGGEPRQADLGRIVPFTPTLSTDAAAVCASLGRGLRAAG